MNPVIDHEALIYGSLEDFLATTVPFCRDGVAAGDGVVVATTERNAEALRRALGPEADDVVFAPAAEVYRSPQTAIAAYDRVLEMFLVDQGRSAARAIGEVAYGDSETWLRYEPLAHAVFEHTPLHVICPYDARILPSRLIDHARRTHAHLHEGEELHTSDRFEAPADVLAAVPPFSASPTDAPVLSVSLTIHTLRDARMAVAEIAAATLEHRRAEGAVIAVAEILANALKFGGGTARLEVWTSHAGLTCRIVNQGPIIGDPLAGYRRPRAMQDGGMGLWIAGQLADEFGITSDADGPAVHLMFRR